MQVKDYIELKRAIDLAEKNIELMNSISVPNGIVLKKGQKLFTKKDDVLLSFIYGDGIALSGDNEISRLSIQTSPSNRAVYIDSSEENLGEIRLNHLTVTGVVQLITRGSNKQLAISINGLDIVSADSRGYPERPMKYGVIVYQGVLTIYNFNPEKNSNITVYAENISVGRDNAPVLGSGIFISGFNDNTGKVFVEKLVTNNVYSNGMIPTGQPNLITGGIFIVYGAYAKEIISEGVVKTYGTNDMVLDVWGSVERWTAKERIISYGPSGIGFVNFGIVKEFRAEKSIETHGLGARGFNQYDGTIENAYFEEIKTSGDGSIGMQFSKPVGNIIIGKQVVTSGSKGKTLVKGEIMELKADAISVLSGGEIKRLEIKGDIETGGEDVVTYHVNGGTVKELILKGNIITKGSASEAVLIENNGKSDISAIKKYINV